jgi:hypothetical protein
LAPSCSVWWLYWNKELTAVSEYCIKSEPSTTGPVLPLTGTPAPQILKSSGRNSVVDRVGLIHEWWLVDFFSLWKLFEDCWDRKGSSVLFEQDCKVTICTPLEATTLQCDLLHFKPWQKLHSHAYTHAMVCSFVSFTYYLIYLRRWIAKKILLWRCLLHHSLHHLFLSHSWR